MNYWREALKRVKAMLEIVGVFLAVELAMIGMLLLLIQVGRLSRSMYYVAEALGVAFLAAAVYFLSQWIWKKSKEL